MFSQTIAYSKAVRQMTDGLLILVLIYVSY